MSSSSQNPDARTELRNVICAQATDDKGAEQKLDAYRADVERDIRQQIAADFEQYGKTHDTLSWGQAFYIARDGLNGEAS